MANYVPTMKKFYNETVAPEMMKEFNYKSFMQVPRIEKVIDFERWLRRSGSG